MKRPHTLRARINIALSSLFAIATLGCASSAPSDPNMEGLKEVLHTEFPTVQGPQASISKYRDNIVLLHFFASWCVECSAEAPTLRNLQKSFAGFDFQIVGVAIDDDPFEAQRFVSSFGLPFPVILDSQGELKHYFSIKDLPVTMLLDKNGVPIMFQDPQTGSFTSKLTGARRWDTEQPVEMIAGLVEGR